MLFPENFLSVCKYYCEINIKYFYVKNTHHKDNIKPNGLFISHENFNNLYNKDVLYQKQRFYFCINKEAIIFKLEEIYNHFKEILEDNIDFLKIYSDLHKLDNNQLNFDEEVLFKSKTGFRNNILKEIAYGKPKNRITFNESFKHDNKILKINVKILKTKENFDILKNFIDISWYNLSNNYLESNKKSWIQINHEPYYSVDFDEDEMNGFNPTNFSINESNMYFYGYKLDYYILKKTNHPKIYDCINFNDSNDFLNITDDISDLLITEKNNTISFKNNINHILYKIDIKTYINELYEEIIHFLEKNNIMIKDKNLIYNYLQSNESFVLNLENIENRDYFFYVKLYFRSGFKNLLEKDSYESFENKKTELKKQNDTYLFKKSMGDFHFIPHYLFNTLKDYLF